MKFGEKIRELRKARNLGQRAVAVQVGISFTYLSKIENEKLDFSDYPSEDLIRRLAEALDADEEELLILAKKVPERIRERIFERPDVFRKLAGLDNKTLDLILGEIGQSPRTRRRAT